MQNCLVLNEQFLKIDALIALKLKAIALMPL
jgi:hypothetical protein